MSAHSKPTEVPLKRWLMEQAEAEHCSWESVRQRYYEGRYKVQLRKVNQRVIYVQV